MNLLKSLCVAILFYSPLTHCEVSKEVSSLWRDVVLATHERNYGAVINKIESINKNKVLNSSEQNVIDQQLDTVVALAGLYDGRKDAIDIDKLVAEHTVMKATRFIKELAPQNNIIMINEAHHDPLHRHFTSKLLLPLYKEGFRYFAVEGLDNEKMNEKGYINPDSGIYTNEPEYAALINYAMKLGFKVMSYDASSDDREIKSAKNIIKKSLAIDKNAKILIHCGYGHIKEDKDWLAFELKKLTGINPLTINQTDFPRIINKAKYKETHGINDGFVLVDKTSRQAYSKKPNQYDFNVFHLSPQYVNQRPSWYLDEHKTLVFNKAWCKESFPCLIEVERKSYTDAVAFDRYLLRTDTTEPLTLRVPKTAFYISTYDEHGKLIKKSELN
ncbi:MAG: hypothetical protein AAGB12_10500 [Pseudomonadota bacterium]